MTPPAIRTIRIASSFVLGQMLVLLVLIGPLSHLTWWQGFRNYFSNDQLSYAAIATNVSQGRLDLVEPFTQTGSLFYPSFWYQIMGLASMVTGVPVWLAWQLLGIAAVGMCVAVVGWVGLRISGRTWAPVVPGILLFTGTLSTVIAGYWYTSISAHAVLWGPYGTLFTLNAESAALSLVVIAVALLLMAQIGSLSRRAKQVMVVGAAALIGATANIQTYSFFTALSLVAMWLAITSLLEIRSVIRVIVTIALLTAVVVCGPSIAAITGPLPLFGLLLAALAPALLEVWKAHQRLTTSAIIATCLTAAPQVVRTLLGLADNDPFLAYREASTKDLGVPLGTALIAALPIVVIGLACALALRGKRGEPDGNTPIRALLSALALGALVMTVNDRWGFNQEPYRFWIQYLIVSALVLAMVIPRAWNAGSRLPRDRRLAAATVATTALIVWSLALFDVRGFWAFASEQGVVPLQDARSDAIRSLTAGRDGLLAAAPCVDPKVLKILSGSPVAHYNRGLAWPTDPEAIDTLLDPGRRNIAEPQALRAAGVDFVISDSACPSQWVFTPRDQIVVISQSSYEGFNGTGTLSVWRVLPP